MKTLLVTPPFSQINTPYPAISYLAGYLREKGYSVDQVDLGIVVINKIFSKNGLKRIFTHKSEGRIGAIKDRYIHTVEPVIRFLKNQDPTLANLIVKGNYLPQSDRFDSSESEAFSGYSIQDHARYLCTLYLNDIADYITNNIDNNFGFSRYSERLGLSPASFKGIKAELEGSNSLITQMILEEWESILQKDNYDVIGITIPFPGNLLSALKIASEAKKRNDNCKVIIGGGWVNTELRDLTDPAIFEYVDYISLDDGEVPIELILKKLSGEAASLKRTYILENNNVVFKNKSDLQDITTFNVPATDYKGLDLSLYISIIDTLNPMHSLWNNGRWNKMTLAHGCYWKRCAFCDTNLPYIADFHQSDAKSVADKMEQIIAETGETGFHFVDEAAPPGLLKALSLEILKRNMTVSWWTNIRFEKTFSRGLAKLMAKSGCIGVSGGVEVASDRLLELMDKGTSVVQVANVCANLGQEGILVHAYLMYGFPTQTEQEVIDALEIVRQLFSLELIQSAYWHQFALTAHSSVGKTPEKFGVTITGPEHKGFAKNDLEFSGDKIDYSRFSKGLQTSLYNYMRGNGFDLEPDEWFKFKAPQTLIHPEFIESMVNNESLELRDTTQLIWTGLNIEFSTNRIYIYDNISQEYIDVDSNELEFIKEVISKCSYNCGSPFTLLELDIVAQKYEIDPDLWLGQDSAITLYNYGLILI